MSWLFSQALVEACSPGICSAGDPSAPSNTSPTPRAFLSPDRTTAFSRPSRFGMTFAPLTADRGEALLMSFLAAFPARTSAWPARAPASTDYAPGSGPTWRASWARFDPASCSWRTAQPSLLGDSAECSPIWPRSGMTAAGRCWELPTSALPIDAIDSGLWPTPTVTGNHNRPGAGPKSGTGLSTAVKEWPTPIASDYRSGKTSATTMAKNSRPLREQVVWRTPGASVIDPKSNVVKLTGRSASDPQVGLADQVGGTLNPMWVEWLMGWPLGWTDLRPLVTVRCRPALQQHGESSPAAMVTG